MYNMVKSSKGITMVSLVMTIVVMVILTAVVVTASVGNNGLIKRATNATNGYENSASSEEKEYDNVQQKMQDIKTKHQISTVAE